MAGLIPVGGGAPDARCKLCGKTASGPCARCRGLVCADCCELTEGGTATFALCLTCVKRGGRTPPWAGFVGWMALVIGSLVAVAAVIYVLRVLK
jgi:hypothetical protein